MTVRLSEATKQGGGESDVVNFAQIPAKDLRRMAAAGEDILECYRVLGKTGDNIVGEILRGGDTFYEWNHYPEGDVYDPETHSQYYYHAHPAEERPGEHGHFHTFLRPKGMPPGIEPEPVPDFTPPKDENDALSHLVAISMDPYGFPIKLFTTNRWVTGEVWYRGEDVCAMLEHFLIDHARPSWPVNRWISAMFRLFRPQMVELVRQRDVSVSAWRADHPAENVYEDRNLEVTSELDISVEQQIRDVHAALERAA